MNYTAGLLLCLLQAVPAASPQSPGVRPYFHVEQPVSVFDSFDVQPQMEPDDVLQRRQARYEEDEFVKRLNTLISALHDFSLNYNGGHVINVKKVKEVREAWHELEKSRWFRPYKGN